MTEEPMTGEVWKDGVKKELAEQGLVLTRELVSFLFEKYKEMWEKATPLKKASLAVLGVGTVALIGIGVSRL